MKRQLTIIILAMMMFVGAYFVQTTSADERGMRHRMGGMEGDGRMHEMMMDDEHPLWRHLAGLGLDEKQKTEVKEIRSRVTKEMIKKRAEAHLARIEMRDLLDKELVDMKAVEAKLKQIEKAKTEMRLSLIRAREEVKSKLTPEQRKKFKEALEMRPVMERRYGHGPRLRGED